VQKALGFKKRARQNVWGREEGEKQDPWSDEKTDKIPRTASKKLEGRGKKKKWYSTLPPAGKKKRGN